MEFGKESLYGWGVCQVPMPRARNDIYADQRRGQQPVDFPDRRTSRMLQPFAVVFAAFFREDFPTLQTGFVVLSAVLLLMIFGLTTRDIAPPIEPAPPEPIEIATRLLQEPLLDPPVAVEPVAVKLQPEPRPQPQPPAVVKQPVVKKVVPQAKKIIALPRPRVEPQLRPMPRKAVAPVERPAPMPQKTIALPALRQQAPLVTTPAPSRPADKYTVPRSAQPNLASARPALGSRSNLPVVAPRKASPAANYRLKPGVAGQPALAQGKSFVPTAAGTTVDLPSASGRRSDFSVPRSQGGHAVATAGRSFAPKPGQSTVDIASAGSVAGSYAVPGSQAAAGVPLPGPRSETLPGRRQAASICRWLRDGASRLLPVARSVPPAVDRPRVPFTLSVTARPGPIRIFSSASISSMPASTRVKKTACAPSWRSASTRAGFSPAAR